eukprot:1025386-Rhodomonas_salina.1
MELYANAPADFWYGAPKSDVLALPLASAQVPAFVLQSCYAMAGGSIVTQQKGLRCVPSRWL